MKYGTAGQVEGLALTTAASQALRANPTLAAGDVQVSKDGGAFTNIATLPAATPAAGRGLRVAFSAAELTCKEIMVQFVDVAGAEWEDLAFVVETYGNAAAKHPFDLATANVTVGSNLDKTGYALSAAGLDSVAAPADITSDSNARSSLVKMVRAIFNYMFNDARATSASLTVRDDGGSVRQTMALSNDGTTQTKGKSS